ncbi:MAG: CRISPR-associated RAMP protein Csx10 [Leptolyngbyaceae cyanobacterium RM2_2_4]|nr:CRISPR-associated RAMP protein Csx10 [Leptolyngbyaceae cyanobacterium RM2_2_4]
MKRIELTITAEAPLAIGQRKPGASVSEATDYIPGTVVRGAIASLMIQQAQAAGQISTANADLTQTDDDFGTLFLSDDAAIFHNAYPAIAKTGEDEYTICPEEVCVLPATALSSKTSPGFTPKGSGVFDSLIDSFCAREQGHFYEPNDLKGDRVEPFKGFYSKQGKTYRSHSISKRLLTRVGINRRRATAEDQLLYSIEVLNETQGKQTPQFSVYRGAIVIDDNDLATQLQPFITRHCTNFRLGGSTSRGLGKVHVQAELQDFSEGDAVKSRVREFNAKLRDRWKCWNIF